MELIKYLNEHFVTKQELLDNSKVTEHELLKYQAERLMPTCSYRLTLNLKSESSLGLHDEEQQIEYYAKGYCSWLAIIQSLNSAEIIYSVFANRYKEAVERLKAGGHCSSSININSGIDKHIKQEWDHFLQGTYGLCTKSGLPEDIAAKEFSILEINELSKTKELSSEQINSLTLAVNLLDSASSLFAPHERLQSSRHRLVNEIRQKYKLPVGSAI